MWHRMRQSANRHCSSGLYPGGLYLWFFRGLFWGGAADLVELSNALENAAVQCGGGIAPNDRGSLEVEDAERGEVILNQ